MKCWVTCSRMIQIVGHRLRENSVVGQLQRRLTQDFSSRVVGPLKRRPHIFRYPLLIIFIEKAQYKF